MCFLNNDIGSVIMGFYNSQVYAVNGLDLVASDVVYTFVNYFMSKFPNGAFNENSIFVDYLGRITDHKRTTNGLENPRRLQRPIAYFVFDGGMTDLWDKEEKPDVFQYSMFPGTTSDRRLISNHRLIMLRDDEVGIRLDTIENRRRFDLQVKMDFANKGDLETCKNYMYNTFEIKKHNYLKNFLTELILPNVLVSDISRLAFNMKNPNNSVSNPYFQELMKEYFNKNGSYDFDIRQYDTMEEINRSIYFTFARFNTIAWRMENFDGKSGASASKDGDSYSNFQLEFEVKIDFKLPSSYVMIYKTFNIPNRTIISNNYLKSHRDEVDRKGFVSVNNQERYFIDTRKRIPALEKGNRLIVREEFFVEEATETIHFGDFFVKNTIYYHVIWRLFPYEREELFFPEVYEDDYPIETRNAQMKDIGQDIIVTIKKCDINHTFMFFLYCDEEKLKMLLPLIYERIANGIFPNGAPEDGYLYTPWDKNYLYHVGDFCVYKFIVWRCIKDNMGVTPCEGEYWTFYMDLFGGKMPNFGPGVGENYITGNDKGSGGEGVIKTWNGFLNTYRG